MAEDDRRISLAGKVLVDKLDAQLLEVQQHGQVVGFGVALTMAGRLHRRDERSTTHLPALQRRHRTAHQ
jgi:hypothetical protein